VRSGIPPTRACAGRGDNPHECALCLVQLGHPGLVQNDAVKLLKFYTASLFLCVWTAPLHRRSAGYDFDRARGEPGARPGHALEGSPPGEQRVRDTRLVCKLVARQVPKLQLDLITMQTRSVCGEEAPVSLTVHSGFCTNTVEVRGWHQERRTRPDGVTPVTFRFSSPASDAASACVGLSRILELLFSLCTIVHPLHTRFANMFGSSVAEPTM
jgi:hypothetical protein